MQTTKALSTPPELTLTRAEQIVGGLIRQHSRIKPISSKQLRAHTSLNQRNLAAIIEDLRIIHNSRIGASRNRPSGFFTIDTAADERAGIVPLLGQIESTMETIRGIATPETWKKVSTALRAKVDQIDCDWETIRKNRIRQWSLKQKRYRS